MAVRTKCPATIRMADENLIRGIGRWDLIPIVINSIIGAGIFLLPSKIAALTGSYSLIAYLVCAMIIGLIILCYAEVSSRFSSTGGPYLYAREALGPVAAFEVGWLYLVVRTASFAVNLNVFVDYFAFFWPSATEPALRIGIVGIVVFTLATINIIGVRQTAVMTNIFTVGKLLPIFAIAVIGLFYLQPENFRFDPVPQYTSFSNAVLILIYAFFGFEIALIPAGEVKDPQRNFPFALLAALGAVAVIYILVQVVCIGTLSGLAASEKPLADAASNFMGPFGATFITAGALISILGNANVGLLGGSRMVFAMGERRELPVILSKTHAKFKTPHVSIALNALIIFVFTIQFSFLTALLTATIARLLVYATSCLSLIIFRRRGNLPDARFSIPFGVVTAISSLLLIGWLMTNVDFRNEGLPIIVVAAIGLAFYYANRIYRMRHAS
jgi:APA family basic amino acid/polyamine antiporter